MISANGVEYKNLPEQVQYLTEKAAEFAVELDRVSTSLEGVTTSVESLQTDVAALQTSYTTLAEDVRIDKVNINTIFGNLGTIFTDITNIKNGNTHLFETITDRHGNPRFVEGDITMNTIDGITQTYGKWSLSGTHLMIIIAGSIANGTVISPVNYADVVLPDYINAKIKPIGAGYIVQRKKDFIYTIQAGTDEVFFEIDKLSNGVRLVTKNNKTANQYLTFRVQFDLLIDDE